MAVRRLADEQPESFSFTPENLEWAKRKIADYPQGRQASAVIPILWKAQEQHHGWLPEPAIRLVADMLEMPYIRVFEVATFYTMFQLKPVGSVAHINVCGTTPCMLRGSEDIIAVCKKRIAAHAFELSEDGRFSWEEVECAGACVNAPMVQIGADTYEDLTPETFNALLDTLASGGKPEPGPQSARKASEPLSGLTSLKEHAADETDTSGPAKEPQADPVPQEDPTTPDAAMENAAKPNGQARAEVEASRSEPPRESGSVEDAPPPEGAGAPVADENAPADAVAVARADTAGTRPPALTRESAGKVDDLQAISGIGPVIESTLHQLGIFTFEQIAAWDQANKDWVGAYLTFKGRIDRERWVEQAQAMMSGKDEGA